MMGRLYAIHLERDRRARYGPEAVLRIYATIPGAPRTLLATLEEDADGNAGFSLSVESGGGAGAEFWTGQILATVFSWLEGRRASEVELERHGEIPQRFKITGMLRPIDAAHVYRLSLQPIVNLS